MDEAKKLLPDIYEKDREAQNQYQKDCEEVNKITKNIGSINLGISSSLSEICNEDEIKTLYDFKKLSFDDVLDTLALPDNTLTILNKIQSIADRVVNSTSVEDQKKYEMLGKMIEITEQYKQYSIGIAGFDSLNDFIENLKAEHKQFSKSNVQSNHGKQLRIQVSNLKTELFNLENALKKMKKPGNRYNSTADSERQMKLARYQQEYEQAKDLKNRKILNNFENLLLIY